ALLARDTVKRVTATICALVVFFSWKVLAPAINRARDQGDDRQFDLLHRASVLTQEADRQSDLLHRASVLTNVGRLAALLWAVLRPG
ncbi:MAG: hypothetical protein ABI920_12955, partial [Casimicrobiaceae bacterium]